MDERDRIDEEAQARRRRLAALAVALPILVGILIAGIVYVAGGKETDVTKPEGEATASQHLVEAATPAEAGTPAPRVRLTEGGGKSFDGTSLGSEPYAVVFISTRCAAIGGFLREVEADLGSGEGAVLAISADPQIDTPGAAARFLSQNQLTAGGSVHYLIGDEDELRGYWNAWGFDGPESKCPESIPAHLVSGAGVNTGVLDVTPGSPAALLTSPLRGMAK
jgi:cytochrome oxidase Cu insertion factor (SCO1/SenC/PrrC family)